ncbi:hypothetical protein [[Kitasatospora] papulosa]|uniref:hypothetical protein n=1 Tax=[Kitasatospora] papulosa TaxID=1464011 RepID=UPI00385786A6
MTSTPGPQATETASERTLTKGQAWVLAAATIPMVVFGAIGGWGTYTNITTVFDRSGTALGVVAAGEGATLVIALIVVGLTMLGQSSPTPVRVGLWVLPAIAAGTGALVAETATEAVVFAVTPMAMCVSAEGMGLLARRIVIYRTGVDMEAQRRNAQTMQRMAVLRAIAAGHPDEEERKKADLKSWKLARKVGIGDSFLGANLVTVQRERMTSGADAALLGMFSPASEWFTQAQIAGSRTEGPDSLEPVSPQTLNPVCDLPEVLEPVQDEVREPVDTNHEPTSQVPNPPNVPRTSEVPEPAKPRTKTNPEPANLSDRAANKQNQIDQVLNLIDELGYDAVKLGLVIERTGMTKTTAYHRLNDARSQWAQQNAA